MSLTIEQLKFAHKIGATHIYTEESPSANAFYRKDKHAYIDGRWDGGWASVGYMRDNDMDFARIDFSPLIDHYADKELDIVAAGGDDATVTRVITVPQDVLVSALDNLTRAYRTLGGLDVAFDSELLVAEALLSKIGVNKGGKI